MRKQLTKNGYDLFIVASALQKAIRRNETRLAGFMALELFPRYSNYAWKRLLTVSAEDCYGVITKEIKALHDSFEFINKGKKAEERTGRIFISKAVILLCESPKSRDPDIMQNAMYDRMMGITKEEVENFIEEVTKEEPEIPGYVYDVHTYQGKRQGKTKGDFMLEEEEALSNKQTSIFGDINLKEFR